MPLGLNLGLSRSATMRGVGGAGSASADAARKIWTTPGLKPGSTATLYSNGSQIATTTVDGIGKATWTLANAPAPGPITYDGVIVGSGGTVPAPAPATLSISGANGTAAVGDTTSFTPTISGGTAPYSVSATNLPPGRSITNTATGLTAGSYTTAGSYNATYTVTDATNATASFTRTVVVSAAAATLNALSFSNLSFTAGAAAGTAIGTITGKTAGSTLSISPNDGRLAFNNDQSALVVGLTSSSAGTANYSIIETLSGATNSPRTNSVTITVNAAASTVRPVTAWRVPLSDVTVSGSTGDTANRTALLASPTNKDFPGVAVAAAGTATITWAFSGAVAAPGAILYYVDTQNAQGASGAASYTTDGANFTAISFTPAHPSDDGKAYAALDYGNGQAIPIPAGATGLRFVATAPSGASITVLTKVMQLQVDPLANDYWVHLGNSLEQQTSPPATIVAEMRQEDPTHDPVVINFGRGGANGQAIISVQSPQAAAAHPAARYFICNGTTSDFVNSGRPYASDPTPSKSSDNMVALYNDLTSRGRVPLLVAPPYGNYPAPNAVNGLANLENGAAPYLQQRIYPAALALPATLSLDGKYGDFASNHYAGLMDSYEVVIGADGVHNSAFGGTYFIRPKRSLWRGIWTGAVGASWLEEAVSAEGRSARAERKARLQAMFDGLPLNPTSAQQTARTTLQSKITALATTFTDAPGYTVPSAAVAVFDFDNFDRLALTNPQHAESVVATATDRSANAYTLSQATVLNRPVFTSVFSRASGHRSLSFRPSSLNAVVNGSGGTSSPAMTADQAAFVALMNAAGQPFSLYWIEQANALNPTTASLFGWMVGTVPVIQIVRVASALGTRVLATTSGSNTVSLVPETAPRAQYSQAIMSLVYDGTTLSLQRDTGTPVTQAFNKPAVTADSFQFGKVGAVLSQTDFMALHVFTTVHNASARASAISNLQAKLAA